MFFLFFLTQKKKEGTRNHIHEYERIIIKKPFQCHILWGKNKNREKEEAKMKYYLRKCTYIRVD